MALIQTTLIWVVYAVVLALLFATASIFVYSYQAPRERSAVVSIICIFTLTSLLATVLLLPVDIALVSSTTSSKLGRRKDWATQDRVDNITFTLRIVYYTLYSLDAILCLLVIPFTYFWYEEYDEVATEDGSQTFTSRLWGAFKYTIAFVFLVLIIFLVGFFVPVAKDREGAHYDYGYFKDLLREGHGERALTFSTGLLITIGTLIYIVYTGPGLALLPVAMIKQAPSISAPTLSANTASALEENLERQRQLEGRNEGREGGLPAKDRRELDALVREERTLRRRERLAAEASGEGHNWLVRAWIKIEAVFRPLKLLGGLFLVVVAILIWVSMLLTGIDKAKNSICKTHCGYVLAHVQIFNPLNWIFVKSSKVFPIDYVLFLLLMLFFFSSSVVGLATIGIRFLWLRIFQIRKGHTSPQALLMATVMLTLMALAFNYAIAMLVAPQYSHWGPQTYCNRKLLPGADQPDCTNHKNAIIPCTEKSRTDAARAVCTPSVMGSFLDRISVNFSFFGVVDFWAQFGFLAAYLIVFILTLFRTPHMGMFQLEQDAEEDEEEGLLASTGRRFGATWQDITGRAKKQPSGSGPRLVDNEEEEPLELGPTIINLHHYLNGFNHVVCLHRYSNYPNGFSHVVCLNRYPTTPKGSATVSAGPTGEKDVTPTASTAVRSSDHSALAIGLGAGIPVGFVALAGLTIILARRKINILTKGIEKYQADILAYKEAQSGREQHQSQTTYDYEAPFNGVNPELSSGRDFQQLPS